MVCRLCKRFDYTDANIKWADIVFTAGGDGTYLMGASKILDDQKPLIGINTDATRLAKKKRTQYC